MKQIEIPYHMFHRLFTSRAQVTYSIVNSYAMSFSASMR